MLTVGLTGGVGSGKSTVAATLDRLGAVVIDADRVAREVVEPGTPTLAALAQRFGAELVRPDGSLDRAALAAIAFPDPTALAALDAITGPAIAERVEQLRAAVPPGSVTVYDMPLLVERRLWPREHLTVVVDAAPDIRLRRLVSARGLTEDDARHRMAVQATDAQRRAAADLWVDNGGEPADTEEQVRRIWHHRLVPYNDNLRIRTGARQSEQAALVAPDPAWAPQAARLVARLQDALGARAAAVEHVGSTSVPGLPARDVVDLQVAVRRIEDADDPQIVARLEGRGFVRVDGTDDALHPPDADPAAWAARLHASADPGRAATVQIRESGSPGWRFALLVRDWLRANPNEAAAYAAEKRRLLRVTTSTTGYAVAKRQWFAAAYPRVLGWEAQEGRRPA